MRNTHSFKMNLPEMSDPVDVRELNDNFLVIDDALMAGLCKKELTTNNMGSSDPASRKYGWAPWIEIYNGNEFDVVVIDRNAPDLPSGTINIEAGDTYRMFINGTYYMNFYVQDQHDVTFKWFTNAETRINEIEPSGGGGVSSVNVIGGSGSHLETSGGPVTDNGTIEINLSEGYSIPQTSKQTAWDSKAADLKLEINSSTFVITAQLKDASGNLIGNERTIDLPLETMVVDGEYDSQTQKIKLELKNGNYVEFSVADLVSGLQTELNDTDNKLDPTYIAYDASHRAVSDTEKSTWNAKQNAISDLETIRSGASAGATAVQPSVMQTALAGKQDTISDLAAIRSGASAGATAVQPATMSTALALKQDSLSEAQLAAVNSGIDSTKVEQISTNQTNILYVIEKVGKNIIPIKARDASRNDLKLVVNPDGSVTISGHTNDTIYYITNTKFIPLETGLYTITAGDSLVSGITMYLAQNEQYLIGVDSANPVKQIQLTAGLEYLCAFNIRIPSGSAISTPITVYPLICLKTLYDIDPSFQLYGAPNYDLTVREAEDRAALVECVDEGAKNLLNFTVEELKAINNASRYGYTWNGNVCTSSYGATITINSDNTISVVTQNLSSDIWFKLGEFSFASGTMLSGCPSGGGESNYSMKFDSSGLRDTGSGVAINQQLSSDRLYITIKSGQTVNITFKPMVCTQAEWKISQNYAQYALPNYDLTRLETEDRNALVEVIDEGVKNVFDLYHDPYRYPNPITATGLTATIQPDGTVLVTGTPTTSEYTTLRLVDAPASYFRKFNGYYLSGSVAPSGTVTHTQIMFELASSPYTKYGRSEDGNPDVAPLDFPDSSSLVYFFIRIYNADTTTPINLTFKPMITTKAKLGVSQKYAPYALPNTDLTRMMTPFFTVPINHNMIYRGQNLGDTLTADQDTALSSGNFTDLYLGDYWTKTVTIPAGTYTGGDGEEVTIPAQTNITLKAVIADFDTFYAGYASPNAGINTHHVAVIVTGFSNVVWNKTNSTVGGYVNSLIHKWLVGSALPQIETWFGSAKVLSHQKYLTNAITGDAASGCEWSLQKISLLSENQMYGSKVCGNSNAASGCEPGEAFKHLNVFNHIDANLLFGNKSIWLREITSATWSASLYGSGRAGDNGASNSGVAPAALILLS